MRSSARADQWTLQYLRAICSVSSRYMNRALSATHFSDRLFLVGLYSVCILGIACSQRRRLCKAFVTDDRSPDVSMKHGILALLEGGPSHGYQLKHDFESRTGGAWLINVGQVYTTLQRLERDGLVAPLDDDEGQDRRVFGITDEGRSVLAEWFAEPTMPSTPPRDELAIKVLLAIAAEHVDVTAVLQRQRTATLEQMQEYARAKRAADPERELPWLLLLDALTLKAEAEIRWLDVCDARLRQRPRQPLPDLASPAGGPPPQPFGFGNDAGSR